MATIKEQTFLAESVLNLIGSHADQLDDTQITGFLSMKGNLYNHELMVVGRAVNGWTIGILPSQLNVSDSRTEYSKTVSSSVNSSDVCPMLWVTDCWRNSDGYNTKRSAFWRVIRAVVSELGIANVDEHSWPSHLVWSNLYKVAPATGGNPSNTLCDIQFIGCRSLLELELSIYSPKRLLFLTGLGWAESFLQSICTVTAIATKTHVEAAGQFKRDNQTTKFVVASHPQGKPEKAWVQEVIEVFQA